jgi:hypothetical protein
MGASSKTSPIRLTEAMGASPKNSPIRPNATSPTFTTAIYNSLSLTVLPSSHRHRLPTHPSPSSRRGKINRPRGLLPSLQLDFSLSANERPRSSHDPPSWRSEKPKAHFKHLIISKPRWIPRSAARRRLERLRACPAPSRSIIVCTSEDNNNNEYKNNNKKDKNKYKNTHELNNNLEPHDIFFTPPSLTLDDVLYWEFKAG